MESSNTVILSVEERDLLSVFMFRETGIYSRFLTWNELMPIVEKIINSDDVVIKRIDKSSAIKKQLIYNLSIKNLCGEVIIFLKWYNNHGK